MKLSGVLKRVALTVRYYFRKPSWNKSSELDTIWNPLECESIENLGTVTKASKMLKDCRRIFSSDQLMHRTGIFSDKEYDFLTEIEEELVGRLPDSVLGHTKHVSYLGRNAISIGYTIKSHASGYSLEYLEVCDRGLNILRFGGRIVAASPLFMHRIEMGRGMTIC